MTLAAGPLPQVDTLRLRFAPASSKLPHVTIVLPAATAYDTLIGAAETAP